MRNNNFKNWFKLVKLSSRRRNSDYNHVSDTFDYEFEEFATDKFPEFLFTGTAEIKYTIDEHIDDRNTPIEYAEPSYLDIEIEVSVYSDSLMAQVLTDDKTDYHKAVVPAGAIKALEEKLKVDKHVNDMIMKYYRDYEPDIYPYDDDDDGRPNRYDE